MKPGLDELEVFLEVAAAKSISRAARDAKVSTSTMSRAIARLEARMGTSLLRRMPRGELLTTAGRRLFEQSRDHVRALRDITEGFAASDDAPRGRLRLTAPPDFGRTFLGAAITEFAQRYPRVQIEIDYTMRVVDLIGEDFDAALRVTTSSLARSALVAHRIGAFRVHLYAAPSYLASRPPLRKPADLREHLVLGLLRGPDAFVIQSTNERVKLKPTSNLWMNDTFALREAAVSGAGIVSIPAYLANAAMAEGTLVRVLPAFRGSGATIYFLHTPVNPVPPQVKLLRTMLTPMIRRLIEP